MEHAKFAFAGIALAASLLGGVAMGAYTVGGYQIRQPTDVIAKAAKAARQDDFSDITAPQAPLQHSCTGCDAQLYRDDEWYRTDTSYAPAEDGAEVAQARSVVDDRAFADPAAVDEEVVRDREVGSQSDIIVARLDD